MQHHSVLALKLSLVKDPRKYSNTLWLYISRYDFVTYCFCNEVFLVIKAIKCTNLSYKKDFDYINVFYENIKYAITYDIETEEK